MADISPEPKGRHGEHLEEKGVTHTEQIDMNNNLQAKYVATDLSGDPEAPDLMSTRIRNPLEGIPREQLMRDVEAFAEYRGLQDHIDILKKGALVAQNPAEPHAIDGPEKLDPDELEVLDIEAKHRWRMPIRLFLTIATCSIGAAVQGWDQTGSNGATIFFPTYYGIDDPNSNRDSIIVGLLNAGPYIGSAHHLLRLSLLHLARHWICFLPYLGTAAGLPSSHGYRYGCQGFHCAYLCRRECSRLHPRSSSHVVATEMWTAFGILLGTAFNLAVFYVPDINWRLMLGAPFIPAVPLMCLIYLCPESPRWYMKKERYPEAWKSMLVLRNHEIQVARDIYYISAQLEIEKELIGKTNYVTRFTQLFTIPRIRRANLAAFTVMIAQQMCGINIIAFYSTTIFVDAGLGKFKAMIGSFGFGLVNWLFAFPAFYTIDTFGRRSLLLFTFPNMFWTLLVGGLCTLMPEGTPDDPNSARTGLVCLFVFLFGAFYSPGEGPVPFTYSAEVYPLSHRETGMCFAVSTCLFWAAVLGITYPFLLKQLHTVGAFGLYAGFNVVAFIMIFLWVPETMQRTLEELDWVFAVPVRTFAWYQITETIPWWFKKYIFFQRNATRPPLYHFEKVAVNRNTTASKAIHSDDDRKY
ncbi:putative polyol transporter 2 [Tolypocladium ophioglossoides CBS 100239]|uniref:Putative polyol transporter 2 n=1 Tax=Tolypocladium ophioglossoides (strain CBS 100239) TaxID=1163406 RepID=A0A0L0MZ76_TOLOC|nr:putative polyol transporter 2 [Tolypocladium ophioglossoides CBS 100239]